MPKKTTTHIESYREYIKKPKVDRTACEQVVGTNAAVDAFAQFYDRQAMNINIVGAYLVHEYISNNKVNSEQFEAYKKAIGEFGSFFVDCSIEKQRRKIDDGK